MELKTISRGLLLGIFAAGLFAHAFYSEPAGAPPGNDAPAPINVSTTDQVKTSAALPCGFNCGGIAAGVLSAPTIILGGVPATSWPGAGSCRMQRYLIKATQPTVANYGNLCATAITAASKTAGWVATGSDTCNEDSATCTRDASGGTACYYARVNCTGLTQDVVGTYPITDNTNSMVSI